MIKVKVYGNQMPYGRQVVGVRRPSTGIYGKRVSGTPSSIAARVRRGRR